MEDKTLEHAFAEIRQDELKAVLEIRDRRTAIYTHRKEVAKSAFLTLVKESASKWFDEKSKLYLSKK